MNNPVRENIDQVNAEIKKAVWGFKYNPISDNTHTESYFDQQADLPAEFVNELFDRI